MMQHPAVAVLALIALTALAGCTSVQDPFLTGSAPTMTSKPGGTSEVAPQYALGSLPGAGKVIAVRQTLGSNSVNQTIVLANQVAIAGENALIVDVGPATGRRFRQAPSGGELQTEMRAAMPGIAMTMTDTIHENAYGIYGYATGRAGTGGSCIYAWQVIDGKSRSSIGSSRGASIRLRLCQSGGDTGQLAGLMRGLSLKPMDGDIVAALRFAARSGAVSGTYASDSVAETTATAYHAKEPVQERVVANPVMKTAKTFATIAAPSGTTVSAPVSTAPPSSTATATSTKTTVSVPMPGA